VGNDADRARLLQVVDEANALLARLEAVAGRTETLIGNADQRVFGDAGLVRDMQAAVQTVEALLSDTRQSLQKVDAVLVEVQGIAANTRTATVDLDVLRAEVEASLRKVESLVNDINRRWPFARDTELKLP
jgi:phospholipid/cholesterol/gamma-HCH transport system substrate-binding protein